MSQKENKQKIDDISGIRHAKLVVYCGTLVLLTVFPLCYHNYYFNILNTKYMFYYCTVLAMSVAVMVIWGISVLRKNGKEVILKQWKASVLPMSWPDICMLLLLLSVTVSTLQSDFKYESFWGNEARFNGLFLWLVYGMAYIMITRLLNFRSNLLEFFLIAGILVCLFGITDYFQMDLLRFKEHLRDSQKSDFVSTIGNVNLYTAYVGMVIAVSMTLFTTAKSKGKSLCYLIVLVVSYLAMIMGKSDNGYLAIGVLLVTMPFYLFKTRTGIKRYTICVSVLITCIWLVSIANKIWPDRVLYLDSIFGIISRNEKLIYGVMITWLVVAAIFVYFRKMNKENVGKYLLIVWSGFVAISILTSFIILYDANIAGNSARYGKLADYLVFSDSWGTDRGFVWRLSMNHFKEFSLIRKLFGYGPDTFGILTHYHDYTTMIDYNNTIYESAHNEYLHYLLTIGLTGLFSYIALLCTSIYKITKTCKDNPYAMATVFAILAYAVQAIVNIAQPIVTPIMFTLLMMGLSSCKTSPQCEP